jgi:Cullin family
VSRLHVYPVPLSELYLTCTRLSFTNILNNFYFMCDRDIEQTAPSMASFRRYLMGRMDRGYQPLCLSSAAASLVFKEEFDPFAASSLEGGLTVHVVAASVWPSHLLCATTYSSLLLPREIAEVKAEFESYFAITNSPSDSHDRVQGSEERLFSSSSRSILLEGAEGQYSGLNGVYEEMVEYADDSEPTFIRKLDGKWIIGYSSEQDVWQLKQKAFKESSSHVAYCKADPAVQKSKRMSSNCTDGYSTSLPFGLPWKVFLSASNTWAESTLRLVRPQCSAKVPRSAGSLVHTESGSSQLPLRRLIWCHTASTAILSVRLYDNSYAYIHSSAPQAAVMLAFRDAVYDSLTVKQIGIATGLNLKELQRLLTSLVNKIAPILTRQLASTPYSFSKATSPTVFSTPPRHRSAPQYYGRDFLDCYSPLLSYSPRASASNSTPEICMEDIFTLNGELLRGALGGLSETAPIAVAAEGLSVSSSSDSLLAAAGCTRSMRSWRNELIDACIVRTLKIASRTSSDPSGYPGGELGQAKVLPVDMLFNQAREILSERNGPVATVEDVMRRAERLVAAGIIKKVCGRSESFRSVSYCYFSDDEEEEPTVAIKASAASPRADVASSTSSRRPSLQPSTPQSSGMQIEVSPAARKVVGEDLYHHLRSVLNIKKLPDKAPGISRQLFNRKFVEWISANQCCPLTRPTPIRTADENSYADSALSYGPSISSSSFASSSAPSTSFFSSSSSASSSLFEEHHPHTRNITSGRRSPTPSQQAEIACNTLDKVAKLSLRLVHVARQQLEALQRQHAEGLDFCDIRGSRSFFANSSPLRLMKGPGSSSNDMNRERRIFLQEQSNEEEKEEDDEAAEYSADFKRVNRSLSEKAFYENLQKYERNLSVTAFNDTDRSQDLSIYICKITLNYLPVGVIRILLNAYRIATGGRAVDYESSDEQACSTLRGMDTATLFLSPAEEIALLSKLRADILLEVDSIRSESLNPPVYCVGVESSSPTWPLNKSPESTPGKTAGLPDVFPFSEPSSPNPSKSVHFTETSIGSGSASVWTALSGPLTIGHLPPYSAWSLPSEAKSDPGSFEGTRERPGSAPTSRAHLRAQSSSAESAEYGSSVQSPESRDSTGLSSMDFDQFILAALAAALDLSPYSRGGAFDVSEMGPRDKKDNSKRTASHKAGESKKRSLPTSPILQSSSADAFTNVQPRSQQFVSIAKQSTSSRHQDNYDSRCSTPVPDTKSFGELIVNDFLGGMSRGVITLFSAHSRTLSATDGFSSDEEVAECEWEAEVNKVSEVASTGTHSQEPMLPCEFCSELIRLAVLQSHQLECGASRGEIGRGERIRLASAILERTVGLPDQDGHSDEDDDEGL